MKISDELRKKYTPTDRTRKLPGSDDVLRLCALVDTLEGLVLHAQRRLPVADQNEIERRLFTAGL